MAVLNVTPDSFSDGGQQDGGQQDRGQQDRGQKIDQQRAIAAGLTMARDGADIIDVGGESTRPGATAVSPATEQDRVIPVIRALAAEGITLSVDTRNADTMRAALAAGARIINDVSGLTHDPLSVALVAEQQCPVVIMHMRGTPESMNAKATYQDVVAEVHAELSLRVERAIQAGIKPEQIVIDPGIGFAKRAAHSQAVLKALPELTSLGFPVLVGVSRKSFIGAISQETRPGHRLGGSLAAGLFAVLKGASILRVHDVQATVQSLRVWQTLFE